MQNNDLKNLINYFISTIPELEDFILKHPEIGDLRVCIDCFKKELIETNVFNVEMDLKLKIILEKHSLLIDNSDIAIHFINKHIQIDDSEILKRFAIESHKTLSSEYKFVKSEQQHYRTITEIIAFKNVDYSHIVDDYIYENHPYVCSEIALAYINAKRYDIGLIFLQKSLNHVFSSPNIYWHNPSALYGCVDSLIEFQHLLGRSGVYLLSKHLSFNILECLYLYLSRAVYLCDCENNDINLNDDSISESVIKKINYLSLRADLVYFYRQEFVSIFGLGINPDIQYLSDKAALHSIATEHGIEINTQDCYQDALNMYQHGSLIPNNSDGYRDIEDGTFGDLIARGQARAEQLANTLLAKYNNSEFYCPQSDIADYIGYLRDKYVLQADISFEEFVENREVLRNKYKLLSIADDKPQLTEQAKLYNDFNTTKIDCIKFRNYLEENRVEYFYHFTDRRNLESIIEHKGLYSWQYCQNNRINIAHSGGSDLSRVLDQKYGLESYVRLSFCADHPMAWGLKCNSYDLVLLKIKVDVAWSKETLFSDINAVDNAHTHGGTFDDLKRIDIMATRMRYLRKENPNFKKHQAEVMVKNYIPLECIVNIYNPESI